jgi:hypothetical protein
MDNAAKLGLLEEDKIKNLLKIVDKSLCGNSCLNFKINEMKKLLVSDL